MGYRNTIHEIQETPGQDPFRFTLPGYFVTLWKVKLDRSISLGLSKGEEDNPHVEAIFAH